MAAEGLLVNGTTEILKKLSFIIGQEIGGAWGIKGDLKKLQSTLNLIQAKLQDAEKRQIQEEAVRVWLRGLKEVAYDIDNILDEFAYEDMRYRLEIQNHLKKKVRCFFSRSNPIVFHFKMAHKIKHINELLKQIKEDASGFQLQVGYVDPSLPTQTRLSRETISLVNDSEILGRDADKSKIIDMLIGSGHQEPLSAIPIVGFGGLGKTTLAQLIYNDEMVVRHFDIRMWVYVSESLDVTQILSKISRYVTKSESKVESRDLVAQNIREEISGKRFLIVLDDVWNEDGKLWEDLKTPLGFGASGSKIVVTTRSDKVGAIMGTVPSYHLERLPEEEIWSLFKKRAFRIVGRPVETPELVQIGREIAKKCGGVPLAAISIGSLMHSMKTLQEWSRVLNSEIWNLPESRSGILPSLKLSYDYLPSPIKQCFAYCSLFVKGETIEKNMLIQLWNAQGFLQISKENKLKADIDDDYFNYLVSNCFFQDVQENEITRMVTCKMHDLLVDLARFVAAPEFLHYEANTSIKDVSGLLHLSITYDGQREPIPEALSNSKKLRTCYWWFYRSPLPRKVIDSIQLNFRYLRVLDLSYGGIAELSSSIGMLKHLRYLDLSSNNIKALPESITNLYNLQTLRLNDCFNLERLPKEMRKLVNLMYLEINDRGCLTRMPFQIGRLKSLQLLNFFLVGSESGYRLEELEHLPLRDQLTINNLGKVKSGNEATRANLKGKPKITNLKLSWHSTEGDDNDDDKNNEDVMQGLEPHEYLKSLAIDNFKGSRFSQWMMDVSLLHNLVSIDWRDCKQCRELPMLGKLPHLKFLKLVGMDSVEYFGSNFYDGRCSSDTEMFPSLEKLNLWNMPKLVEWIEVFPAFRCLKELVISGCPELKTIQTQFPSLQDFVFQGSNDMVLSSVSELNSLTSLEISDSPQLTSLPKELIQNMNLRKLKITKCPKLEVILPSENQGVHKQGLPISLDLLVIMDCLALMSLPDLWDLQSLRKLHIGGFSNLISLPQELQGLIALETLEIGPFSEELDSFPAIEFMQHLASLRILAINGWSKLTSLPSELQYLSTLKILVIHKFHGLVDLPEWLGNLSTLRTLDIESCHNLMYLPSAEAMRRLTTLRTINIVDCPLLKERCKNERGEERYKVAHIPQLQFW